MPSRLAASARARDQLAAVAAELNVADHALYTAIAQLPTPVLDRLMRQLSRAANHSVIWLTIAAGLAMFGGRRGRRAAIRGTTAIGISSALVNIGVKSLYDRPRPDRVALRPPAGRTVSMPSSKSFPSGHSASAFAFAAAAGRELPWLAPPLRALATAVAYSRVHTGVHYPADAVAGSIIGASIGATVTGLADRTRRAE
jgi:membrane-associated phospholipid phosphatase